MSEVAPPFEHLRLQLGPIAELWIDRPRALNALSIPLFREIDRALEILEGSMPRVLIVAGAGERAFVAGADIAGMRGFDRAQAEAFAALGQQVFGRLEQFAAPVIAAVQGFALGGGCELALACDFVFAAHGAQFGQPEVKLGLLPGFGGTWRLARKLGPAAASRWILGGEIHSAAQAQQLGWVAEVVDDAQLLPTVQAFALQLASRSPSALRAAKALLLGEAAWGAAALTRERRAFAEQFERGDAAEGIAAFLEKRPANFSHF